MKKKQGFTLAELLIVVAIIGVLVAVSIPIFTSQLAKARRATNQANARAAYAAAVADLLDSGADVKGGTYDVATGKYTPVTSGELLIEADVDYSSSFGSTGYYPRFVCVYDSSNDTFTVTPQDTGKGGYNETGTTLPGGLEMKNM